jgi:DNA replication protein DnaC
MIDEIGRSSSAKAAQDAFFRILDARYEAQLPSLLATNLNRTELIEVLGEATYDRLTQGGSVRLTFDWDSRRSGKAVAS